MIQVLDKYAKKSIEQTICLFRGKSVVLEFGLGLIQLHKTDLHGKGCPPHISLSNGGLCVSTHPLMSKTKHLVRDSGG